MKTIKEIESYKIDKNVPMPGVGSLGIYPWDKMEVGDSFLVKGKNAASVRTVVWFAGKQHGRKFSTRTVDDGVRVWRIK